MDTRDRTGNTKHSKRVVIEHDLFLFLSWVVGTGIFRGKKRKIGITAVGSFSFFLNETKNEMRKFGGKWRVYFCFCFFCYKNCWRGHEKLLPSVSGCVE